VRAITWNGCPGERTLWQQAIPLAKSALKMHSPRPVVPARPCLAFS